MPYSNEGPTNPYFSDSRSVPHLLGPTEVHSRFFPVCSLVLLTGTSFASPHVTGAGALILSAFPSLSGQDVFDTLLAWALPIDPVAPHVYLPPGFTSYAKGDVDCSGAITAADIIYLIGYVFHGGPPPCPEASNGDINCNGSVNAADVIYLVGYVFQGGPPPLICRAPVVAAH